MDHSTKTVVVLREELKRYGLPTSGDKSALVERLTTYLNNKKIEEEKELESTTTEIENAENEQRKRALEHDEQEEGVSAKVPKVSEDIPPQVPPTTTTIVGSPNTEDKHEEKPIDQSTESPSATVDESTVSKGEGNDTNQESDDKVANDTDSVCDTVSNEQTPATGSADDTVSSTLDPSSTDIMSQYAQSPYPNPIPFVTDQPALSMMAGAAYGYDQAAAAYMQQPYLVPETYAQSSPTTNNQGIIDNKIFVGGLHPYVNEQVLRQHFECFGPIKTANVVYDRATGQSKGFGFIEFESNASVTAAINSPHFSVCGKFVDIRKTNQSSGIPAGQDASQYKIYVNGVDGAITDVVITEALSRFGTIHNVNIVRTNTGIPKGFAFVQFTDTSSVEAAVKQGKMVVNGRTLEFGYAQNKKKLQPTGGATLPAPYAAYDAGYGAYGQAYSYPYSYQATTSSYPYDYSQYYGSAAAYSYPPATQ